MAAVGVGPFAKREAHSPVVAEVEHVGDLGADGKIELCNRDVGGAAAFVGQFGRRVLELVAAVELVVEPERVQVVIEPPEGLLDDVVECPEMLVGSDGDPRVHAAHADQLGVEHQDAGLCRLRLTRLRTPALRRW